MTAATSKNNPSSKYTSKISLLHNARHRFTQPHNIYSRRTKITCKAISKKQKLKSG